MLLARCYGVRGNIRFRHCMSNKQIKTKVFNKNLIFFTYLKNTRIKFLKFPGDVGPEQILLHYGHWAHAQDLREEEIIFMCNMHMHGITMNWGSGETQKMNLSFIILMC